MCLSVITASYGDEVTSAEVDPRSEVLHHHPLPGPRPIPVCISSRSLICMYVEFSVHTLTCLPAAEIQALSKHSGARDPSITKWKVTSLQHMKVMKVMLKRTPTSISLAFGKSVSNLKICIL